MLTSSVAKRDPKYMAQKMREYRARKRKEKTGSEKPITPEDRARMGGQARAKVLKPARRRSIARKAGAKRWADHRGESAA